MNEPIVQANLVSGSSTAQYIFVENKTNDPQIATVAIKNFKTDVERLSKVFSVRIESDDELHRLLYGPTTLQQLLDHGPVQLEILDSAEHQSYAVLFTADQNIEDELQKKQLYFDLTLNLTPTQTSPKPSPRSSPVLQIQATPMVLGTNSAQLKPSTQIEIATPSPMLSPFVNQGNYLFTAILSLLCALCLLFFTLGLLFRRPLEIR